jgi:asparagine synthase (glutamine-hydrolysing)
MQMIYGSISWDGHHDDVSDMIAALKSYPWKDRELFTETTSATICSMAVTSSEHTKNKPLQLLKDGNLTIAADIRIDNRKSLLSSFALSTGFSELLSDCQLILMAYKKWGIDCAGKLLGDFAFSIWDTSNKRLFSVRDHAGVRPFYYFHQPGRQTVFASDLLALLAHPNAPQKLNLPYVKAFLLSTGAIYQHPAQTYYLGIQKLPPATALLVDHDGLKLHRYWYPGKIDDRRYKRESDYVDELRQLLHEVVECRVDGIRHAGAHLSGGLDSSSLAVLAHRTMQKNGGNLTGYSWAPPISIQPPLHGDERILVEAVCQRESIPLRYTTLKGDHLITHFQRDITRQPTTTLQMELSASEDANSQGITAMLSGWGGDELLVFNGRGYFSDLFRRGRWVTLQRELAMQSELHGGTVWKDWIIRGIFPLLPEPILQRLQPNQHPTVSDLPDFLKPDFQKALSAVDPLKNKQLRERPGVRRMQIALLENGHISYRMESWAAHGATLGITYLYPLLDNRLVEFALSIPDHLFFKNGWKRYLYRTAMEGILPDNVRWNKSKFDTAMIAQHQQIITYEIKRMQAKLQERVNNPYVDIKKLKTIIDQVAAANDIRSLPSKGLMTAFWDWGRHS